MLYYCLKCRENTEHKNPKVVKTRTKSFCETMWFVIGKEGS